MSRSAARSRVHDAYASTLRAAARELAQEAARLAHAADVQVSLASHARRMAELPRLLKAVRNELDTWKRPEAEALAHVAHCAEFPLPTLAAAWAEHLTRSTAARRWVRDRELMRLAWAGHSNAAIAQRLHLHPKSVSRILQTKLKSGRALTPGAPCTDPSGAATTTRRVSENGGFRALSSVGGQITIVDRP